MEPYLLLGAILKEPNSWSTKEVIHNFFFRLLGVSELDNLQVSSLELDIKRVANHLEVGQVIRATFHITLLHTLKTRRYMQICIRKSEH